MDKTDIRLRYGRVGLSYHGSIMVQRLPTLGFVPEKDFSDYTFPRMMSHLARVMRSYELGTVVLSRIEAENSEYELDRGTIDLLCTDPAAAISAMTHEDRVVKIRDQKPETISPPMGLLRAGHDTIAAAFGDRVYCRLDEHSRFECVGCGRWSVITPTSMPCTSRRCTTTLYGLVHGKEWFSTPTAMVLRLARDRYYIPRDWNPGRGWISHGDLAETYETYVKEKERCFQENAPKV